PSALMSTLFPYTTLFRSLRGPHLMLADSARDDRFTLRDAIHRLDYVLRLHQLARAVVVQTVRSLQLLNLGVPLVKGCTEAGAARSEEHTSELQSRRDLVC